MIIEVMLVSPDREFRRVVKSALEGLPLKISAERSTAKEALDYFRGDQVDIVISDLFLGPEATGLEAVKAIKKTSDRVKYILLTRLSERSVVDRAVRFGASDVIIYPCEPATIRETVKHRLAEFHVPLP